jgi:hypothetical protein
MILVENILGMRGVKENEGEGKFKYGMFDML